MASGFNLFYCYRSLVWKKNRKGKPHSSDLKPPLTRFFFRPINECHNGVFLSPFEVRVQGLGVCALPVASELKGLRGASRLELDSIARRRQAGVPLAALEDGGWCGGGGASSFNYLEMVSAESQAGSLFGGRELGRICWRRRGGRGWGVGGEGGCLSSWDRKEIRERGLTLVTHFRSNGKKRIGFKSPDCCIGISEKKW